VLKKYPNEVKLVVKQFPLPNHSFALQASKAALAANMQGKFWEMHDALLKNYNALDDKKLQDIAKEVGLDWAKLEKDMNSPSVTEIIKEDVANAREVGVRGTPTVFLNGKNTRQRSLGGFSQEIEAELAKGKK